MVTIDVCEQWNTLLKTSRKIRKVNPDYGIMYEIQCAPGKFKENNSGLRDCQKHLFAKDEFVFVACDELVSKQNKQSEKLRNSALNAFN